MKFNVLSILTAIVGSALVSTPALSADLSVTFADAAWNGKRIPSGQHCKKFGGNGSTPPLSVSGIPSQANAIIVEFNDKSYNTLSYDGGHGKVGFLIQEGTSEATLNPVPGGTKELPEGTWLVAKNRARGDWTSDGYLPPCSGGKGNKYTAEVLAVVIDPESKKIKDTLAKGKITLGKY